MPTVTNGAFPRLTLKFNTCALLSNGAQHQARQTAHTEKSHTTYYPETLDMYEYVLWDVLRIIEEEGQTFKVRGGGVISDQMNRKT